MKLVLNVLSMAAFEVGSEARVNSQILCYERNCRAPNS